MLAILYLFLCASFGSALVMLCIPDIRRLLVASSPSRGIVSKIPSSLFVVPAGTIIGMVIVPMFNYYAISIIYKMIGEADQSRSLGTLISFTLFAILTTVFSEKILKRKANREGKASLIPDYDFKISGISFYGICITLFSMAASFIMFWTYRIEDGKLIAGFSVFSDMSPHTAMASSFSSGFNFPTQYMHFAGDGIQYHFFFNYLCGMLNHLGLPLDWALNLPSIISMVCCFCLLGLLAMLISKRRAAFALAPLLVLFRSSLNVFKQYDALRDSGKSFSEAIKVITHYAAWYDNTPFDSWGVWAINVYANQRHLMLGMSLIIILILLMLPFVRRLTTSMIQATTVKDKALAFIAKKESWLWRKDDPLNPLGITILACLIVIAMPYFHGSALIAGLLVLAVMAIFSESRLCYLAVAISAVTSSVIQTQLFSGGSGNVVKFQYLKGFVATDKDFNGIVSYLWNVTLLTFVISGLFAIIVLVRDLMKKKPCYRFFLFIALLAPAIFAFNFQVSLEMLANHKFIQFTLILVDAYVAGFLANCFYFPFEKSKPSTSEVKTPDEKVADAPKSRIVYTPTKITIQVATALLAAVLLVPLTATGISEWHVYYNINKAFDPEATIYPENVYTGYYTVDTNSELLKWIKLNTDPQDVLLTSRMSMNRIILAGRPIYYGWPYYAWSAGHDTNTRQVIYDWLITCCNDNPDEFVRYCKERGIKYFIYDRDFFGYTTERTHDIVHLETFDQYFVPLAYFPDDNGAIVYQIYE